ncbi:ASG_G0000880.mRNA.1.CDS.1 [Saccharomyces cerevisiae]|nr:AGK_G0000770.mRNA.1.CDS.1 [Saccharomyces cerevisiae]CAI4239326.1 CPG_1a_G0000750.mRNA.1.CDS.1 [Saccharomyces cerevisiae]CAI4240198.1 BLD_1a_G0000850.mRNA.1.CDS.1 [Saccharomyces cerevisiae]CAI4240465.1 CFS_G0000800.mRNA.1.CDS.1 [Saccharomyces cerevisiae]CAI4241298.1 CRL_G0000800.mRNA.1.CDS.1 [Saccharomyces cerevisiae]
MSSSPLLSRNAEDTQSSVSAGKTSNGPNNFDSIRSDPILMAYVLKATQIEKEAQIIHFTNYEGAHCKPIMVMFLAAVILISLTNFRVYHLMSLLSSFFISGTDRQ